MNSDCIIIPQFELKIDKNNEKTIINITFAAVGFYRSKRASCKT